MTKAIKWFVLMESGKKGKKSRWTECVWTNTNELIITKIWMQMWYYNTAVCTAWVSSASISNRHSEREKENLRKSYNEKPHALSNCHRQFYSSSTTSTSDYYWFVVWVNYFVCICTSNSTGLILMDFKCRNQKLFFSFVPMRKVIEHIFNFQFEWEKINKH